MDPATVGADAGGSTALAGTVVLLFSRGAAGRAERIDPSAAARFIGRYDAPLHASRPPRRPRRATARRGHLRARAARRRPAAETPRAAAHTGAVLIALARSRLALA